ncbi:MAG TPA: PPOX class F420-dependent oxidoreductase [Thermomicrobiales bacterium]|nr:PPOX class F420-dependent oxidoreductase [Thermomicrobiales bacterium]
MPKGPVPAKFHPLLESAALAHLATIGANGHPQVNPIWFLWRGESIQFGVKDGTAKLENIRRDPHVALSILDRDDPGHYVELRGEVTGIELYLDLSLVNELARKYTGEDFTGGKVGEPRYRLTMRVDSWTGQ